MKGRGKWSGTEAAVVQESAEHHTCARRGGRETMGGEGGR